MIMVGMQEHIAAMALAQAAMGASSRACAAAALAYHSHIWQSSRCHTFALPMR